MACGIERTGTSNKEVVGYGKVQSCAYLAIACALNVFLQSKLNLFAVANSQQKQKLT